MLQLNYNSARQLAIGLFCCFFLQSQIGKGFAAEQIDSDEVKIIALEGSEAKVLIAKDATAWKPAEVNQVLHHKDRFRTMGNTRATVRLSNQEIMRISESAEIQVWREPDKNYPPLFKLVKGWFYVFHRNKLGNSHYETPHVKAVCKGTEFVLQVETNSTTLTPIDGEVEMESITDTNNRLSLVTGEEGVSLDKKLYKSKIVLISNNLVQWALYYPQGFGI